MVVTVPEKGFGGLTQYRKDINMADTVLTLLEPGEYVQQKLQ